MKILVATFTYFPNVDGVAEAARMMVSTFRKAGHEVVIATKRDSTPARSQIEGAEVYRFDINGSPAVGVGFSGECNLYTKFVEEHDLDVIVIHCWDTWSSELLFSTLPDTKAKTVLLSHGYSSHILDPSLLPRGIGRWLRWLPHVLCLPWRMRRFDKVVFLSRKSDWSRFIDVKVSKLTGARNSLTIPNGVGEPPRSEAGSFRCKYGIGGGVFFLCVANYSVRKNQKRALQAYAAAHTMDSTIVFIGSEFGEYGSGAIAFWEELKSRGARGTAIFLERVPREDVFSALYDCDVKILAADAETQPIVLLEAMAASKPFITTKTGCVEELRGGLVVQDTGEMATAMQRLSESPVERKKLGEEGRGEYLSHYSLKTTSRAWLDLLDELEKMDSDPK